MLTDHEKQIARKLGQDRIKAIADRAEGVPATPAPANAALDPRAGLGEDDARAFDREKTRAAIREAGAEEELPDTLDSEIVFAIMVDSYRKSQAAGEADEADGEDAFTPAPIRERLRRYVARIEANDDERAALRADRSVILAEAAQFGFDKPTLRRIVRLRKIEKQAREEQSALDDLYLSAVEGDGRAGRIPLAKDDAPKRTPKPVPARVLQAAARANERNASRQAEAEADAALARMFGGQRA